MLDKDPDNLNDSNERSLTACGSLCTGGETRYHNTVPNEGNTDAFSPVKDLLGEPWPPAPETMRGIAEQMHPGVIMPHAPLTHFPSQSYCHFKRVADVLCASVALVTLSPVLLVCAFSIKLSSSGPVLFKQERWGRKRVRFDCWKLRTMVVDTPPNMPAATFENKAAYMTPVGDFLRRWSLDELPQLFNILKGDMSVVGPRPVIVKESRLIDLREPLNAGAVRPGLTGWAQVNGRNLVDDEEKALLDGEYVANMSLWFDIRIFFKTIATVLSRKGVDRDVRKEAR